MLVALAISIVFSLVIGILAARNRRAESVIIPLLDVFQSIPILGFFPIVILGVIAVLPGQAGVNLAVIILIFTSMSWNIAFGVYEAVKSIPQDYVDLTKMSNSGFLSRFLTLYLPSSLSRIAYNTQTSWAVGLFYLVSSEVISLGSGPNSSYSVDHGIGVTILNFWNALDYAGVAYAIVALLIAVAIWQFVFLREFTLWAEKYKFVEESREVKKDALLRAYSWVTHRSISKLFLLTQGRGVTRFTSAIYRFRTGIKYAVLIFAALFIGFVLAAIAGRTELSFSQLPKISAIISDETSVVIALAFSFLRVWYVYFLCVLIGLPLGIGISLHTKIYAAAVPLIQLLASIPAPVFLPLIYLFAEGQGEVVAGVIIFFGMIWYILFNVMAGIRTLPAEIWELRKAFHISTLQAWRNIYLPASMTAFVTGSITAIGAAWNTLIVAEYFSFSKITTEVGSGIGKTIAIATNQDDLLTLTLAIVSMTVLIVVFNLTVWRRVYHHTTRRYAYNR